MGVGYCLVNKTKKEMITYVHLPANTANEITGNPVTSAITTWYLIRNSGDEIGFVPDQYYEENCTYNDISLIEIKDYKDMTDETITQLINNNILKDIGVEYFDEDDLNVYLRKLKNIWLE